MHFTFLTLFPDFFSSPLKTSIIKRAKEKKITDYSVVDIRRFAENKHNSVDDKVYGGGAGMLMQAEPIALAIEEIKKMNKTINQQENKQSEVIFFSPIGEKLTQKLSYELANNGKNKILLCGHYEGIDERVLETHVDRCISIGETVVTGGEIPALFFLDSVVRLLPNVISSEKSHQEESFSFNLYGKGEFPQYTRPENWRKKKVPEILLSGHQKKIEEYNLKNLKNCSFTEKKIINLRHTIFSIEKPYKTKTLLLRIPQKSDINNWIQWFTDSEVCKYTSLSPNQTNKDEENFFEWQHYNLNLLNLQIIDKKSKKHIGAISLEINDENNSAVLWLIIGDKNFWNKGIATESTYEIIRIAKKYLELSKITLEVFTENIIAQKVYEKCGARKIGVLEKHICKEGKWSDVFLYELVL